MIRYRRHRRHRLHFSAPPEWLTTQVCAIALVVLASGVVTGVIGAIAYAFVKGLHLE
jgi:hypothetical protein